MAAEYRMASPERMDSRMNQNLWGEGRLVLDWKWAMLLRCLPQEDVDLFVQDVQRQDAKGIVLLDTAGSSVFVECTLRHAREDLNQRIGS